MSGQSLQDFVSEVSGTGHLRVEHDFGDGFVRLQTSEAERRQAAQDIRNTENIVLELLRNSRDAHATKIFLALSRDGDKRIVTIIDNGDGIPPAMHEHVFEPRVTSKLDTNHMDAWGMHGRGMALYSISVNSEKAFVADSNHELGCAIRVETDVKRLPERTDQSSFPTFELLDGGRVNIRGPKNIVRTACEFAIEARDSCSVYVGSPVEIASTIYAYGMSTLSTIDRVFCKKADNLPLVKRLATSADPDVFCSIAEKMGIEVSQRSARRIMDGEIPDAEALIDKIAISSPSPSNPKAKANSTSARDSRSFKLGRQDAMQLVQSIRPAFDDIAERYYLENDVEPIVRARHDRITITIPVVKHP